MEYIKRAKESEDFKIDISKKVSRIISDVRINKDQAIKKYTLEFDNINLESFKVTNKHIQRAYENIDKSLLDAIIFSIENVKKFAKRQKNSFNDLKLEELTSGVHLGHRQIPVDSALCYIPGGNHPLFSTAIMLIVPAKVAGVKRVVATSPIDKTSGTINDATLVAMDMAGAEEIYCIGGVQAIAGFAYGTESLKKVNMIVGPGNTYVTEAKRQCYGDVGIDFLAGPSEVLIISDDISSTDIIARDILAQCEHDKNSRGIFLTWDRNLAIAVDDRIKKILDEEKYETAKIAYENNSGIIVVGDIYKAIDIANDIAPEHLELIVDEPTKYLELFYNYGSLFLGKYSAEVFGDYTSGTNHTLPTSMASKYTGGLSVLTFLKTCTHQLITKEGFYNTKNQTMIMAQNEGLICHKNAVKVREEEYERKSTRFFR